MTDSLQGVRVKMNRAAEHLEVLNKEIARFLASNPYRISRERHSDGNSSTYTFRVHVINDPPDDILSPVMGDALQNMRSALDHIVWQIGLKEKRNPNRRLAFPIVRTPDDFQEVRGKREFKEIDTLALDAIEKLQPYKRGDVDRDPLLIVHELARLDRHQTLRFLGGVQSGMSVSVSRYGENDRLYIPANFSPPTNEIVTVGPFKPGAIVTQLVSTGAEPGMDMDYEASFVIGLREAPEGPQRPIMKLLVDGWTLIDTTIIPALVPFTA